MDEAQRSYRQVAVGETVPDAVTVGIEANPGGGLKAAVWWGSTGDVDADEAEYGDVETALAAAEAARELHGLAEVVIALQEGLDWQPSWGLLSTSSRNCEPVGDVSGVGLSDDEAYDLAAGIEAERDA